MVNATRSLLNVKGSIMSGIGKMADNMGSGSMRPRLSEKKSSLQDESGYRIQLDEITFNQIYLKWGSYSTPNEKLLSFHPVKPAIVSHFRLVDPPDTVDRRRQKITEKQFVVYRESAGSYDLCVAPTKDKERSFFELIMSDHLFNNMLTEESGFLMSFPDHSSGNTPSFDFTAPMEPAMYGIINDMQNAPYSGYLKGLYLETKAIELFLLQVKQLDQVNSAKQSRLKPGDIECLYEIRNYIELHYDHPGTITDLARRVGINQMKLKNGFKELFNTTVFGYVSDVRMQEAKRLLLEEKMYIHEVADRIGYKHPHHFTAAFKKRFGVLPGNLKK